MARADRSLEARGDRLFGVFLIFPLNPLTNDDLCIMLYKTKAIRFQLSGIKKLTVCNWSLTANNHENNQYQSTSVTNFAGDEGC